MKSVLTKISSGMNANPYVTASIGTAVGDLVGNAIGSQIIKNVVPKNYNYTHKKHTNVLQSTSKESYYET